MIEISNISKVFTRAHLFKKNYKTEVLNDINLNIDTGEFVALLGNNGCGKSTLTKLLCGVLNPTKGEVLIDGKNAFKNRKKLVYNLGVVFNQKPSFLVDISVKDNFQFFRSIYNISIDEFEKTIKFIDKYIKVLELFDKQYRRLSFGQRVRCEIASVLMHNPGYIFLDEPTIGLDLDTKKGLYELLKFYNETYQSTIIIITHDMKHLSEYCSKAIVMDKGRVIFNSKVEDLGQVTSNHQLLSVKYNNITDDTLADEFFNLAVSRKDHNHILLELTSPDEEQMMIANIAKAFDILSITKELEISYKEVIENEH